MRANGAWGIVKDVYFGGPSVILMGEDTGRYPKFQLSRYRESIMRYMAYVCFVLFMLLTRPVSGYDAVTVELKSPNTQLVRGEPLYVVLSCENLIF